MTRLALLVAIATLLAPSIASADPCPVLVPGQSLGPIKIGMTEAQLAVTGLTITRQEAEGYLKVGDFGVYAAGGVVASIDTDVAKHTCVNIDGEDVELSRPLEALALTYPKACGEFVVAYGGDAVKCEGASFYQHRGGRGASVTDESKPIRPCARYVSPGEMGDPLVSRAKVDATTSVCVMDRHYTHDLVPDDIVKINGKMHVSDCQVTEADGTTTLNCAYSGLRFVFSGPTANLTAIEAIAVKF